MKEKEMTPLGLILAVDEEVFLKTIIGLSTPALLEAHHEENKKGGDKSVCQSIILELAKRADWQEIVSHMKKEEE